ncbi:MAG: adenylyl-sulfate kinase, partial [Pseudomonadota bacterium]|nr:adenylyl-sulfate kinase [Pseudomonadota bacterium]
IGANTVTATVQALKYEVDVNTQQHFAAKTLAMNAIGVANVITDQDVPFAPYTKSRDLGGFILIDKVTNRTVAAGMIHFALRRATNIHWHASTVTREDRSKIKGQKPLVIWMTGLSGSGKSTIANCLETKLAAMGRHTFLLDGDNVRHGLNKDLGFQGPDRIENIRRVGEVAKLMMEAGLIVIAAFISPFRAERELVRAMMAPDEFFEVFVDTPLEVAESRDVKGLYAKARAGQIRNFTGIESPYEAPEKCEIKIDTAKYSPDQAADLIIKNII